jgi:hypothetical protein
MSTRQTEAGYSSAVSVCRAECALYKDQQHSKDIALSENIKENKLARSNLEGDMNVFLSKLRDLGSADNGASGMLWVGPNLDTGRRMQRCSSPAR